MTGFRVGMLIALVPRLAGWGGSNSWLPPGGV